MTDLTEQVDSTDDPETFRTAANRLGRESPSFGTLLRSTVPDHCMAPQLKEGDTVLIAALPAQKLRRGDLVVFLDGSELVTRRLVDAAPGQWIVKGDRLGSPVLQLRVEDFLGIAVGRVRGGRLVSFQTRRWRFWNRLMGTTISTMLRVRQAMGLTRK